METNAPVGTKRKRRPASACEPCRRKKIRCDRSCPCEHCARTKTEYCSYLLGEEANGDGTTNGRSVSTTKVLGINGTIASITSLHPSVDHTSLAGYTAHGRMPSLQRPDVKITPLRGTGKTTSVSLPLPISSTDGQQQKVLARSASHERDEDSRANSPEKKTSEEDWTVRGVFSKNRFYGQSHWMNSVHQFPEVYKVIHKLEAEETGESRAVYETCRTLTKAMKAIQPLLRASLRDYIPPRKIAEQLIQAYLRTFESAFRILHVPSFLLECDNYWTSPELASEEFIIRLMLVMAIGIGFCPDCTGWTASSWIHAAQAWLGSPSAKNRVKISGVQIHCLLLLARQSNNIGADFIWISAGALLRTAMQIGLHIDPSRLPGMSFYDQEIRRRLWATVLEITIQTTMDSGGVPLISIQDIDCEPPSNIEDGKFDQNTQTPPSPKPPDQFTQTSVQIALMKSFPVRLKIARVVNNFRTECPFDQALQLSAQLSVYCQANFLRFQPQACSFAVRLLELLMLRFLLALHHPFAMKARDDPTLYFSRKVSLEVSLSLMARFSMAGNAPSAEKDYARLALIGAGIFRNVPVQAASTICEDLICQFEEEFSSFTPISNSLPRCNLRRIIEEYTNILRTRMSINENTIRGYLKFTSLLAQIDALQTGASVEDSITIALRKGLLQCQQILQTRADESWVCRPDPVPPPNGQLDELNDIHDWLATGEMVNDGSPFPMFFS